MRLRDDPAGSRRGATAARPLPAHLRYAKAKPKRAPDVLPTPSELAAALKGITQLHAAPSLPRVVELYNMAQFTHATDSAVPLEEPIFQPSPPEVVIDDFEPLERYSMPLCFRNNDSVARRIKVLPPDSSVFSVDPPAHLRAAGGKVAPGVEVQFRVVFTPRAAQDYQCELECVTEREKFLVSVRARGPRPCFEFPDAVDFGLQPVRVAAQEVFLLRNTGLRDGRFSLSVAAPFSVSPSDGLIAAGQAAQIVFGFRAEANGAYAQNALVSYDSGEQCLTHLSGSASDIEVALERSIVAAPACYISLSSQRTVKLYNRSQIRIDFEWKALASAADESRARAERIMELSSAASDATGPAMRRRRRDIELDPMLFVSGSFAIEPARGEIYPGGYCELTVVFSPQSVGNLSATAYCEVAGRESRLPLMLQGSGLGPRAMWLYDTLDIGDVYVNAQHRYEVVLDNHGEVSAAFSLEPSETRLGSCFRFSPSSGQLVPNEQATVEVWFKCGFLGDFSETFVWTLDGSPSPLPLVLKGNVIGPSLHFSAASRPAAPPSLRPAAPDRCLARVLGARARPCDGLARLAGGARVLHPQHVRHSRQVCPPIR